MEMHTLRSRHSFPPLRKSRASYFKESIDQDPFAYFISPASEQTVFLNEELSAGIDTRKRARSHSPVSRVRATATHVSSPTSKLKKWIERMELRCFHRSPRVLERPMPSPDPPRPPQAAVLVTPLVRGRGDVRTSSSLRINPNARSKPRRPRVWREPSEGIWSVAEEKEDDGEEVGLGISV